MTSIAHVVGIDDYDIGRLHGCVNDARAFAKLLEVHEDQTTNFAVKKFENVLHRSKLKQCIIELFKRDDETLLFYFSGHGMVSREGVAYIITTDYEEFNEGISMDEILYFANKSKARNKFIILDCCHSGKLGSPLHLENTTQIAEGVTILASSRDNESSIEVNGHGVFTNLLLEALKGGAADIRGNITMGGIYAYIDRAMGPFEQRPVFKTNVMRFVPIRKVSPAVSDNLLRLLTEYFVEANSAHELKPSYEPTNTPISGHFHKEPYFDTTNGEIFSNLQAFVRQGLVKTNTRDSMYFEAMEGGKDGTGGSCSLTALGQHYWNMVKKGALK